MFSDLTGSSKFENQVSDKFGSLGVVTSNRLNDIDLSTIETPKPKTIQKGESEVITNVLSFSKSNEVLKPKSEPRIREESLIKINTSQKQEQKNKQRFKLNIKQRQRAEQTYKKFLAPIIKPELSISKRLAKKIKEEPEIFTIFATKGGIDIERGKAKTQKEAELTLKNILKGELRAGGFISKGKVKLKATELKEFGGGEFRLSKVSPYKVIQRKEKRLGTRPETKELQYFKGSKSKKAISIL
jgi:hypothetical protein